MNENGKNAAEADQTPQSFEQSMKALEEAVRRLEEGQLSLDESLRLYQEGIEAYRRCHKLLTEASLKVRKLDLTVEGELAEEPFEPPGQ